MIQLPLTVANGNGSAADGSTTVAKANSGAKTGDTTATACAAVGVVAVASLAVCLKSRKKSK